MGLCQIIKNGINFDLFEIIQFCLKIYDLLRPPHLWMGGLLGGSLWGQVKSLKIN